MKRTFESLAAKMHEADPEAEFAFEFWDGTRTVHGSAPRVVLHMKNEESARHILAEGFLGFGEGYMAGGLEVEGDLQELLRLGFAVRFDYDPLSFRQWLRLIPVYLKTMNTRKQSRKNIQQHYDLGDDFYRLYLDETLTYSCAYFKGGDESLAQAQLNKYDYIARKLMLCPGERLLDIGCGWGGMLIHSAQNYGIFGFGNTLSENQFRHASRRIRELGLESRIRVECADYRDLSGEYDKFVSIGMFEHVGKEFIPVYMQKVSRLLKRGGLGLLHTIGKDAPVRGDNWTMRYIFPGSYIPNLPEVVLHMGRNGFSILDVENLRLHYARTLDLWAERFESNVDQVRNKLGERFVRMWRLYLNASSAAFKYGEVRVYQILFSKGLNNALPLTRAHQQP